LKKRRRRPKKQKSDLWVAVGSVAAIIILAIVIINLDNLFPSPEMNITYESPDVYATVNGVEITGQEIEDKYSRVQPEYQAYVTKAMILNQTIFELLFVEDLEKKGITISDEQVEALIDEKLQETVDAIGQEEFDNMLAAQNTSAEQIKELYWDSFRLEIILEEMNAQFFTEEEIMEYYINNSRMINSSHILICFINTTGCTSNLTEAEALETITDIRNQIIAGASFEEMAMTHSTGPSGPNGGSLGVTPKKQFVQPFDDVAWSLDVGQISEPVKTTYGYHIIKLNGRIDDGLGDYETAKKGIIGNLLSSKQAEIQEYYNKLYEEADVKINYKEMSGCSDGYGVDADTVVFYHTDTCPHCQRMKPVVNELEAAGVKFHWANAGDGETVKIIEGCYPEQRGKGVPQFICAGTGKVLLGERPKDVLEQFAQECRGA